MWQIGLLLVAAFAKTAQEWKSRTIYQLLTDRFARPNGDTSPCADISNYCGGGFKGIQDHLDYITGMGFDAIWISPVPANTPGSYHGYAAQDIYTINPYFGGEQAFIDFIQAAHARDIWIMLDVVANHMGPVPNNNDFSILVPFNVSSDFHNYCQINDWNNMWEVQNCWLFTLPDLDQSNTFVRTTLLDWITWIVTKYDIDGLRVDTVVEVPPDFWTEFSKAAGVFATGEVFNGDINLVASYQGPLPSMLNYPLFFKIKDLFLYNHDMYEARSYMYSQSAYPDQSVICNFVDNHDNARFLSINSNINRFKSALAWSLVTLGIPIVYYGSEQAFNGGNDPYNREPLWPYLTKTDSEMYVFLQKAVAYRKTEQVWNYSWVERYVDHNFYSFSRGTALAAFTNTDATIQRTIGYHPYNVGDVVCNIFWDGDCVTVTHDGVPVTLTNGEVKLYKLKSSQQVV
mmetsp:Transcript_22649/g.40779  ORF Transcript_22649/g.40779 Transcript_22649/m.40779 type:complete len:458 (+) Transcript_22649:168-1541(+)